MSWSERFVRDHKRQTDCAIRRAYAWLSPYPYVAETFHAMLHCARKRAARLFEAPLVNGRHLGVDALMNLSRFSNAHVRPVVDWEGTTSSWRPAISSLAHHLICDYKVPEFLTSAWHATDSIADDKRGWFVAHSGGASFRSLDLPIAMTRRMEHIFLASHDHLPIEHAMRKAELLALGAPVEFVKAVMSTRLATDLSHGEFWRTVWLFLIANADDVDPAQIAPMIDYIQAVRHDRITVETPNGNMEVDPPEPAFSIKGRTVLSMQRLMKDWHQSLGGNNDALSWAPSPFEPLLLVEPSLDAARRAIRWQLMELTNSAQLRREGAALHHCVASYAGRCCRGVSSIWSLRLWQGDKVRPVLTVEVDSRRRTVVQARGRANRTASGKLLRLLHDWAIREGLRMEV